MSSSQQLSVLAEDTDLSISSLDFDDLIDLEHFVLSSDSNIFNFMQAHDPHPHGYERSESSSSNDGNDHVVHKNTNNNIPMLRVVKTDIRRQYSRMLGNVLNSYDLNLAHSFFHTFATPDLVYRAHFKVPASTPGGDMVVFRPQCNLHITGIEPYLFYLAMTYALCPDRIIRYADTKILIYPDRKHSQLDFNFSMIGTAIFDVKLNDMAQDAYKKFLSTIANSAPPPVAAAESAAPALSTSENKEAVPEQDAHQPPSKKRRLAVGQEIVKAIDNAHVPPKMMKDLNMLVKIMEKSFYERNLPRFPRPIPVILKGRMIMNLDENKRLERVDQISEM